MHLFFENIGKNMFLHWFDGFNGSVKDEPYTLPKQIWQQIGQELADLRRSIPTSFGKPPRNIAIYWRQFTAEEWRNWITIFSLPLLYNRLPLSYLKGW